MEEKRMIKVTVDGVEHAYPHGTPYRPILEEAILWKRRE